MELPIFPLHLVLYPGRPLPLHLFESRYRQMLRDCLDDDGRFGVVAIRSGREVGTGWRMVTARDGGNALEDGTADDEDDLQSVIHDVGTLTEIKTVAERQDGRFDIITRGTSRFRILEPLFDKPYMHAVVEPIADDASDEDAAAASSLRELLIPYMKGLGVPDEFCDRLPDDPRELSYLAASALQVEVPVQQRLLELPTPASRMRETARIIRRESGIIKHLGLVGSFRPPGPCGAQLN